MNIAKFLRTDFFIKYLQWLLLEFREKNISLLRKSRFSNVKNVPYYMFWFYSLTVSVFISYVLLGCFQNSQNNISDCDWIRTHYHLGRKWTLGYFAKLALGLSQTHNQLKQVFSETNMNSCFYWYVVTSFRKWRRWRLLVHTAFAFEDSWCHKKCK